MAEKIVWNERNIRRLKAACDVSTSIDDVVEFMSSTRTAITCAMHRHGIIIGRYETDEHGHVTEVTLRKCLACDEVFGSRGKHNRLCRGCGGVGSGRRVHNHEREAA